MLKNRFPFSKNYYPRPSLTYVQFEENNLHPQSVAHRTGITEWNIDGMARG